MLEHRTSHIRTSIHLRQEFTPKLALTHTFHYYVPIQLYIYRILPIAAVDKRKICVRLGKWYARSEVLIQAIT